jgi:hypothetical protein
MFICLSVSSDRLVYLSTSLCLVCLSFVCLCPSLFVSLPVYHVCLSLSVLCLSVSRELESLSVLTQRCVCRAKKTQSDDDIMRSHLHPVEKLMKLTHNINPQGNGASFILEKFLSFPLLDSFHCFLLGLYVCVFAIFIIFILLLLPPPPPPFLCVCVCVCVCVLDFKAVFKFFGRENQRPRLSWCATSVVSTTSLPHR